MQVQRACFITANPITYEDQTQNMRQDLVSHSNNIRCGWSRFILGIDNSPHNRVITSLKKI